MKPSDVIARAGGPVRLSKIVGHKTHTSVMKWKRVPVEHCPAIEEALGIPREQLRPDVFRAPAVVAGAADRGKAA